MDKRIIENKLKESWKEGKEAKQEIKSLERRGLIITEKYINITITY